MQIPQYERRPREIPTYKPLQENWRFANPYPSSIEVGKAPIGEALGAIGSGLLGLRNKLLEMEDAQYLNVQAPKMYVATQEIFAKYDEFADPEADDYPTGRVAYFNQEIEKYKDNPSSGYDKRKTAQNTEMDEKIRQAFIYPQLKADFNTQATARAEAGKRGTQLSVNSYHSLYSNDLTKVVLPAMRGEGDLPENLANMPGSLGYAMKNIISAGQQSITYAQRHGLITPDVSRSMSDGHIAQAYITEWNTVNNSLNEAISFIQGEMKKDNPNMSKVFKAYSNALKLLNNYEVNFQGHTYVVGVSKDDTPVVQTQVFFNENMRQIEKHIYDMEKAGEANGVYADAYDNSILSQEKRTQIEDGISSQRGKFMEIQGSFYKTKLAKQVKSKYQIPPQIPDLAKKTDREAVYDGLDTLKKQGVIFSTKPEWNGAGIR